MCESRVRLLRLRRAVAALPRGVCCVPSVCMMPWVRCVRMYMGRGGGTVPTTVDSPSRWYVSSMPLCAHRYHELPWMLGPRA